MPQFAANLSMMYTEHPFLDRFEAAAKDGFRAVECMFPYAWPAAELAARLRANGLQMVLFNAPAGGAAPDAFASAFEQGWRGTASLPGRERDCLAGLRHALDYAAVLGCPRIHLMAGLLADGGTAEAAHRTYVDNLRRAAGEAAPVGVDLLIEPINPRDMPRYFLNRQQAAHAIVQEAGQPNLKVQMDLYHCQIVEGDLSTRLREHLPTGRVGHLQIAGVPSRHEPDIGELNYPYLFDLIDDISAATGWQGWVGCEYRPLRGGEAGGTSAGLGWRPAAAAAPLPA